MRSLYLPELDRLRFFAALAVFIHHSHNSFTVGRFGVDLFFCLSAFLITRLLVAEKKKYGEIDAKRFYFRRMFRIFPLYYFFLLFVALPLGQLSNLDIAGLLFVFSNIVFTFHGYPESVAAPLWSVSVEEHFYLAFPFLYRWIGSLPVIAAGMLAVSIISRLFIENPWTFTLTRLDPIALGILLTYVGPPKRWKALWIGVGLVAFVAADVLPPSFGYPLAAVASALIVFGNIGAGAASTASKVLIYLGRISYGLYVFHVLALRLSDWLAQDLELSGWRYFGVRVSVGFVLTVLFAVVSYHLLETPFLKLKDRFARVRAT